ncbi:CBU_0592 family membrane protein [Rhodalgimonas zhirmunskyi]|uniref:CBU_0592 family membrane protein n=1 Tax=Rhodalgimonas zhirmunskyi TaxID=2964767 RepID=UPI0029529536|nr:hypothetical protein [Rhodoalgimonas zhirmunskyi]
MYSILSHYSAAEFAGVAGFLLYVFNYSMLSMRRVSGDCIGYYAVNICAASLVLIGLSASFNLAAAMIQTFFILMSSAGIILRLYRAKKTHYQTLTGPAPHAEQSRSALHLVDVSQGTGSPDRVYG